MAPGYRELPRSTSLYHVARRHSSASPSCRKTVPGAVLVLFADREAMSFIKHSRAGRIHASSETHQWPKAKIVSRNFDAALRLIVRIHGATLFNHVTQSAEHDTLIEREIAL